MCVRPESIGRFINHREDPSKTPHECTEITYVCGCTRSVRALHARGILFFSFHELAGRRSWEETSGTFCTNQFHRLFRHETEDIYVSGVRAVFTRCGILRPNEIKRFLMPTYISLHIQTTIITEILYYSKSNVNILYIFIVD